MHNKCPVHGINQVIINEYYKNIIVHVRDPRQVVLSNLHNILRNEKDEPILNKVLFLPDNFFSITMERQLDYLIDDYLPYLVTWLNSWINAQNSKSFTTEILFTTFEEFKSSNINFINKIPYCIS